MKERPILFSGAMVRAILDGRKTQTRRLVKPQPPADWISPVSAAACGLMCPYGAPGDRLWVRETWRLVDFDHDPNRVPPWSSAVEYRDGQRGPRCFECDEDSRLGWRPSIHMPRWASRLTLDVTCVRVERLQDLSEEDARAEGAEAAIDLMDGFRSRNIRDSHRAGFRRLWDSINGERAPWTSDPWVWVVEFKVVKP